MGLLSFCCGGGGGGGGISHSFADLKKKLPSNLFVPRDIPRYFVTEVTHH